MIVDRDVSLRFVDMLNFQIDRFQVDQTASTNAAGHSGLSAIRLTRIRYTCGVRLIQVPSQDCNCDRRIPGQNHAAQPGVSQQIVGTRDPCCSHRGGRGRQISGVPSVVFHSARECTFVEKRRRTPQRQSAPQRLFASFASVMAKARFLDAFDSLRPLQPRIFGVAPVFSALQRCKTRSERLRTGDTRRDDSQRWSRAVRASSSDG